MSQHIIGTSQAVITAYEEEALATFTRVRQRMQLLVTRAFALTYQGPDAETVFNPGLIRVATESVGRIDSAMESFARAVSTVTSNISRSLGAGDISFVYRAPVLELPPAPGVQGDDYRIDVGGFESFIGGELVEARQEIARLIAANQDAFNRIPRATADRAGWSGEARDYAQNTVVPAQTENLTSMVDQVMTQISEFMTSAKDGTLSADRSGVGGG